MTQIKWDKLVMTTLNVLTGFLVGTVVLGVFLIIIVVVVRVLLMLLGVV